MHMHTHIYIQALWLGGDLRIAAILGVCENAA